MRLEGCGFEAADTAQPPGTEMKLSARASVLALDKGPPRSTLDGGVQVDLSDGQSLCGCVARDLRMCRPHTDTLLPKPRALQSAGSDV